MTITCIKKHIVLSEDPGKGVLLIKSRPHKEFAEMMQCPTREGQREYPLPWGFNPKKIEGVQYVPDPLTMINKNIDAHEEKNGDEIKKEG
jgi:hypothetical protein